MYEIFFVHDAPVAHDVMSHMTLFNRYLFIC